jgi:hypothetical protein
LPGHSKAEDSNSDRSSTTEPTGSKQGSPASAGRAHQTPASKPTSRRSSKSSQSAAGDGSPKDLHVEETKQKARDVAPTSKSEARRPTSPANVGPASPSVVSHQQDETTTSINDARPD